MFKKFSLFAKFLRLLILFDVHKTAKEKSTQNRNDVGKH